MPDPFTIMITGYIAAKVPHWLEDLRNILLDKGKATALAKGKAWLDEEKQQRLLQPSPASTVRSACPKKECRSTTNAPNSY
jgi:hypothetical protein